jgi:D-sedoheptulose 7-phosphate isomerase
MIDLITKNLDQAVEALAAFRADREVLSRIDAAGTLLFESLSADGSVYSCGNGGSMCDAMHFAEELSGKFRKERRALAALAISDPAHLSCTANDFGYEAIFSRFIEAHGRAGDVLLAISTSGSSPNILKAAEAAKQKNLKVIGLTGRTDAKLGELCDVHIPCAGGTDYSDRIQELHIKVIHTLIDIVETRIFS